MKRFQSHGFECAIVVGPLGNLNGYVRILDASHPSFGKHYDSVDCSVHGGLTYSDSRLPRGEEQDGWWLGFDACHAGDFIPAIPDLGGELRDEAYVMGECESLARQLSCLTSG
jgi:hypothetical protein